MLLLDAMPFHLGLNKQPTVIYTDHLILTQ